MGGRVVKAWTRCSNGCTHRRWWRLWAMQRAIRFKSSLLLCLFTPYIRSPSEEANASFLDSVPG